MIIMDSNCCSLIITEGFLNSFVEMKVIIVVATFDKGELVAIAIAIRLLAFQDQFYLISYRGFADKGMKDCCCFKDSFTFLII